MEREEKDALAAILGEDQLFRTSVYDLLRKDGWVQIIVREGLHGPHKGKFQARPRIQLSLQHEDFLGEGNTATQALTTCLTKIKHVQIQKHIPDHDDSDPDWSEM